MRKLLLFTNISLDGYFEDANHDISGFTNDFEAFSDSEGADALLLGRKTYDMMTFWGTPQAEEMQPEVARFMNQTPKYVASHQPFEPGWQNVTVISGDIPGEVQKLKAQPGSSIMMFGSNTLCVSLMPYGLIDEFQIIVNPVAFGGGTPLFSGLQQKAPLTLTGTRRFASGSVLLTYHPA